MESSDRDILISINGKLERIESRLDSLETRVSRIEERTAVIERRLDLMQSDLSHTNDRIDWLQTSVYWGFAVIAFVAAFVPVIKERKESKDTQTSENTSMLREMRYIARDEIEQALKRQ